MKINGPLCQAGFTLVEIMIVVAIIGLLAAIAIPSFLNARTKSQATTCINNMRQIDAAVQQVTFAKGKKAGDTLIWPDDVSAYIKMNSDGLIPGCPALGKYKLTPVGDTPSVLCSLQGTVTPDHVLP